MQRRQLLFALSLAAVTSSCGEAIDRTANAELPDVTVLDASQSALKAAFNDTRERVRLLFIIGPSCGPCLRGTIDTNDALGRDLLSDRRLSVFVVGVPTLGAQIEHMRRAARLMQGSSVHHYWDPRGVMGELVQQALQIPLYAWDVWLTYAPGPVWEQAAPPAPVKWMHQLGRLHQGTRLDAAALAADVRARVGELS